MRRFFSWSLIAAALIVSLPAPMRAQVPTGVEGQRETIDGIAAIVGGEIILKSDVELLFLMRMQEQRIEPGSMTDAERDDIRSTILQDLIDQTLIVARALRDSIVVERGEVEEAINQWMAELQESYGGESAFQQQLNREGITIAELRRRRRPLVRNQLLRSKLLQELGIGRPTAVSRRDAAEFVREHADELLFIRHLLLEPPADIDPDVVARQRIEELWELIVSGREDFETIARQYSDDPNSGPLGGDLGEAPMGTYVASVDSTVWNLPIGEVSEPVRSQFGWHLIQVISRDEERAQARHILIRGVEEGTTIRALADTISMIEDALAAGESFIDLVERFSDEEGAAEETGYFGMLFLPLTAANSGLSAEWIDALQTLEPGDWTGPLELENTVHFVQRIPWDESTVNMVLRNDFPRVELIVQQLHDQEDVEAWLDELRRETYIEIKKE